MNSTETLEVEKTIATIKRIVFYNQESGYTVAAAENGVGDFTVLCHLPFKLVTDTEVCIEGQWVTHQKYGRQLQASSLTVKEPTTEEGIIEYLSSGIINGIGPSIAERIVKKYGDEALQIIDENPEMLLAINGIGKKTLDKISKSWIEKREGATVVAEITFQFSISVSYASKIYKHYGKNSVSVIKDNPYKLTEIWGIGFKKADEVAKKLNFIDDYPPRVEAGVIYVLNEALTKGHCYLPYTELKEQAIKILSVSEDAIENALNFLQYNKKIAVVPIDTDSEPEPAIYLYHTYQCENYVSNKIANMATRSRVVDIDMQIGFLNQINFTHEQIEAVNTSLTSHIAIITGSAGTGKTTTLKKIIRCIDKTNMTYALCAPTGRAAERISEITGRNASTIHRLLKYKRNGEYERNEINPLPYDYIIVDEASMIDIYLMHNLLKATKETSSLILIGDSEQLPPVGPGSVFKDIIQSNACKVVRLSLIQRQAAESPIIRIASDIIVGKNPYVPNKNNAYIFSIDDPQSIAEKVCEIATIKIRERFGIGFKDVQVLSPMKRGHAGVDNLNLMLQAKVQNSNGPLLKGFMLNDKVMQIKNNYEKDVFNGDIGYVNDINYDENCLTVDFEGHYVDYNINELDEIKLAYCCTVHKYQGSESRCVVIALHSQHYPMLKRNLIYTAVTRAKEMLVIVGQKKAIAIAVKNASENTRYTGICRLLSG